MEIQKSTDENRSQQLFSQGDNQRKESIWLKIELKHFRSLEHFLTNESDEVPLPRELLFPHRLMRSI